MHQKKRYLAREILIEGKGRPVERHSLSVAELELSPEEVVVSFSVHKFQKEEEGVEYFTGTLHLIENKDNKGGWNLVKEE